MNDLGERIYTLRKKRDMSQGDLAEKLDVSRQTISKWENNASVPELDKLLALSNVFGVTVDYIVKGEGESPTSTTVHVSEPVKAEAEKSKLRMITVDPTKKYISGLSVFIGTVNLIMLLYSVFNRIQILTVSPGLSARLETWPEYILSTALTVLLSIALLSQKEKLLSAYFIISAVQSFINCFIGFSQQVTLDKITAVLAAVASIAVAVGYITANKKNAKIYLGLIVSLRLICFAMNCAISYYNFILNGTSTLSAVISVFNTKIWAIPTLLINILIAVIIYLKGNPKPTYLVPENAFPERNDMYVGIAKHTLLLLFTFGIYDCIWVYKTTENLNFGGVNQIESGLRKLLLCIFVPFYRFYWYYSQSKRLEAIMKAKGNRTSEFAVVTLIMSVFIPIVAASVFLQVKINEFAEN